VEGTSAITVGWGQMRSQPGGNWKAGITYQDQCRNFLETQDCGNSCLEIEYKAEPMLGIKSDPQVRPQLVPYSQGIAWIEEVFSTRIGYLCPVFRINLEGRSQARDRSPQEGCDKHPTERH
jgi:hypothetical protein